MSNSQVLPNSQPVSVSWQVALWAAQILLALLFGAAGVMKTFMAPEALASMGLHYATDIPVWLLRFIGISELAGTVGVILPALTRIKPALTPLAALGFATIQVLAIGFHLMRDEVAEMAPMNLAFFGLSVFVLWGRSKKAPVRSR